MCTLDATLSMLQEMSESQRVKVFLYAKQLINSEEKSDPYKPVGTSEILSDLEESRQQISDGDCYDMQEVLTDIGKCHGYI